MSEMVWIGALLAAQLAIDPPAEPGAIAPNPTVTAPGEVQMTWIEGQKVRISSFDGKRWRPAKTVVQSPELFGNWADFPAVAKTERDLVVSFLEKSGSGKYAYDVELARSKRGGAFVRTGEAHDDGTQTEHGFVSFSRGSDGLWAFWLDGREMAKEGPMTLRAGRVKDGSVAESAVLDDRVCECCGTSAAHTREGPFVVYRDRGEDEVRNINIVRRTKSGWSAPQAIFDDAWKVPGCPVNGPAADAAGQVAVVAWYTGAELGRARVAFSKDSARTFKMFEVHRGEAGAPLGRVSVVLTKHGAVVSWLVADDELRARIVCRHVDFDGTVGPATTLAETSPARTSGFPRMVKVGDQLLFAWTEVGPPTRVRAKLVPLKTVARSGREASAVKAPQPDAMPKYAATTLDGRPVTLESLRGQVVLINLWATWCGPCRDEMPVLTKLAARYPSLVVVGINVDEAGTDEQVRRFVKEKAIAYTVWRDPEDRASRVFGSNALPASFLLDRSGRVVLARHGVVMERDPALSSAVEAQFQR